MENSEKKTAVEKEFSILTFFRIVLKHWIAIAVVTVIAALFAGLYTGKFVKTKYTARVQFYAEINYEGTGISTNSTANYAFTVGTQIAKSVVKLATTDTVVRYAITSQPALVEELGCETSTAAVRKVSSMISVANASDDTSIFTLTVTSANRTVTYVVAEAMQKAIVDCTPNITSFAKVKVVGPVYEDAIGVTEPPVIRNTAIGAVAGAVLTVLFFVVLYFLDTVIYDEQTVKENFDYPVIGRIPSWNGSKSKASHFAFLRRKKTRKLMRDPINRDYKGKLLGTDAPFGVTEAFNMLRTNVAYAGTKSGTAVYAVTSAFSGAGKSTISTNLSIAVSMLGKKILLVECDMRCPAFRHIFHKDKESTRRGLSDILAGLTDDPKEVIRPSGFENLDVIFAGHLPPNPSELLASENMKKFLDRIGADYDCVILDMPPICEVADAGVVAPLVNGYLMTVRSGYCDISAVKSAISLLDGVNANILGIVLNDIDPKSHSSYRYSKGYYYYSSADRYGVKPEESESEAK